MILPEFKQVLILWKLENDAAENGHTGILIINWKFLNQASSFKHLFAKFFWQRRLQSEAQTVQATSWPLCRSLQVGTQMQTRLFRTELSSFYLIFFSFLHQKIHFVIVFPRMTNCLSSLQRATRKTGWSGRHAVEWNQGISQTWKNACSKDHSAPAHIGNKQKMLCMKKRTRIARKFFLKRANDELENNDENKNEIVNLKVNNFPPKGAGRENGGIG